MLLQQLGQEIVLIIDIDSTVADNEHRALLLEKNCVSCGKVMSQKTPQTNWHLHRPVCDCGSETFKITQESWDMFLRPDLVEEDPPIPGALNVLNKFRKLKIRFHFVTGRGPALREATERWLTRHMAWDPSRELLVTRNEGEVSPASVYKRRALQWLADELQIEHPIFIMFDDDPFVLREFSKEALVIRAPDCWTIMDFEHPTEVEETWRR